VIVLLANEVFTPEHVAGPSAVVVDDDKICGIWRNVDTAEVRRRTPGAQIVDVRPGRLAPGFIDLHTHGFQGHDVSAGSQADIAAMARALPSTGVTAFYPAVASIVPCETRTQVERVTAAMAESSMLAAEILGIRLEGPFISPIKRGAQYAPAIRRPDPVELDLLASIGPIRMVDFAPEEDQAFALLEALVQRGITPAIGHTMATFEQTVAALDAGARHCTHLFNAMPPLDHRAPGAAGALLTDDRTTVEIIADGIHLHPALLQLIVATRGPRAVALVTDAAIAASLPEGSYTFLKREILVHDGAVRLADGTLAGSVLTMERAVRNMVDLAGVSWSDAIRMATLTPASVAGVANRKGALAIGYDADIVVLDEHGTVEQTWRAGRLVYGGDGLCLD
jgi:N-acetylglucosamine-6-phosphate deacetylase